MKISSIAIAAVFATVGSTAAFGQAGKTGAAAPPVASSPAPNVTTATFLDWTLKCNRLGEAPAFRRSCELENVILAGNGQQGLQAQIAVGRVMPGEPLKLTVVLPPNVQFIPGPRFVLEGKEALAIDLVWSRCLPGSCFASAEIKEELIRKMKEDGEVARVEYRDGPGREVKVAVSLRGFNDALEALKRDSQN